MSGEIIRKPPEKKAEQPQEAALYTIRDAIDRRNTVIRIMKVMDEHPSVSDRTRQAVNEVCRELLKTIDDLSTGQTREESTRLQKDFTDLMKDLRKLVTIMQAEMLKAAEGEKQHAEAPKPVELKPQVTIEKPKPVVAPKPAPKIQKPDYGEWKEPPKPAPQVIKPAAPAEDFVWREGKIAFTTRDSKRICRVAHGLEKWAVDLNEDGSWEVRLQRPGGVIVKGALKGGKFEGTLEEGNARAIYSQAFTLALAETSVLRDKLKQRAKEKEEEEVWRSPAGGPQG